MTLWFKYKIKKRNKNTQKGENTQHEEGERAWNALRTWEFGLTHGDHWISEERERKGEDAYLKWLKPGIKTFLSAAARGGLALRCDAVQAGALRAKGLGGDHGAEPVRSEH